MTERRPGTTSVHPRTPWRAPALAAAGLAALTAAAAAQNFNDAPPNGAGQRPAFAGQTRAPVIADRVQLRRTVVADGLVNPWGMAQLPDGGWLVTERPGRLRHVQADGRLSAPIQGLPKVDARGQGGLLDVAIRGDFAQSRRVWWSYAEPLDGGMNRTAVATGVLSPDNASLSDVRVIFRQDPAWRSTYHFGSRWCSMRTARCS